MPDAPSHDPVLIAGAGIGGLAAAIALARAGMAVRVLERAASFSTAGAGIQLGPNATRLLHHWGVLGRIARNIVEPSAIVLRDGLTGKTLARVPLGPLALERYGAPYVVLHRRDLHDGLLWTARAEPGVTILPAFEVTDISDAGPGVAVHSADGRSECGRALIAADGLFSAVRATVFPHHRILFTGHTAWRALVPPAALPEPLSGPEIGLWMAPEAHFVHYPVQGGDAVNLVAVVREPWRGEAWEASGDPALLLPHFAGWAKPVRAALEQAGAWGKWSLYRLAPLPRWTQGGVALLGDAAHPILPFLAQGGAMAIEDAATLARALSDPAAGSVTNGLRNYESLRRRRVARVQRAAERMGRIYHFGGPLRRARNAVLGLRSSHALLGGFDWLYRHDAEAA